MRLFHLRTWHRLCLLTLLLVPAVALSWIFPDVLAFQVIWVPVILFGVGVCLLGAFQGILFAMQKLEFGCPDCDRTARVTSGGRQTIGLECPTCGRLVISVGVVRLKVARPVR